MGRRRWPGGAPPVATSPPDRPTASAKIRRCVVGSHASPVQLGTLKQARNKPPQSQQPQAMPAEVRTELERARPISGPSISRCRCCQSGRSWPAAVAGARSATARGVLLPTPTAPADLTAAYGPRRDQRRCREVELAARDVGQVLLDLRLSGQTKPRAARSGSAARSRSPAPCTLGR